MTKIFTLAALLFFVSSAVSATPPPEPGLMRITEWMYDGAGGEFVEFTNVGGTAVDMTGWSFDDNSRQSGSENLSAFGMVQPGESVILSEGTAAAFRAAWNLCAGTKIIGPYTNNLGRNDEINLYNGTTLVDRLTYDDQGSGNVKGPRTTGKSAWVSAAGLGANMAVQFTLSAVGDAEGSYASSGGAIGSPGKSTRATVSFNPCAVTCLPTSSSENVTASNSYTWNGVTYTQSGTYTKTGLINAGGCDSTATLILTVTTTPVDTSTSGLSINLANYVRVGRYNLPEPTRTTAPVNSLLAQEVSAVTYNWDTESLFVVGDGGTSVVQVTKTGQLINSMTLAPGASPQGTDFYDPEGLTYIGNGKFVMSEERDRQLVLFTYVAGGTLTRATAQTVKIGTFVQNIGIEGLSYDPITGGYICVKESGPMGIFQTGIDFNAGTATNGSPTTENSVNLFNPALTNLLDFADVYALSNIPALTGKPNYGNLLVLSQESGKIINIDRSGNISSSLTIVSDAGNPLTVAAQQHEGLTMDRNGVLYVVSENGGGDFDHPQLWVYAPSNVPNQAPTAVALTNKVDSILENTNTASPVKVSDIVVTDADGQGINTLTVSGTDAAFFEINGSALYIKAGTVLDYETKTSYNVTVNVDDATAGNTPDATVNFTLTVKDVLVETPTSSSLIISEVAPWSSGNSPLAADWFEVTNTGTSAVDITGWKVDDASHAFATAIALNGITTIAAGESVIFIESAAPATIVPAFKSLWFGANAPANLQIGTYSGSGIGLSTGGDEVNLFNNAGIIQASVTFGASPAGPLYATFNNAAGLNNASISQLSVAGTNGAFIATNDTNEAGSPGTIGKLFISEVSPWSSSNSPFAADWFEVTNTRATAVDITGWKIDDNSGSPAAAIALNGITSIAAGESVIFVETADAAVLNAFRTTWFGTHAPAGLQVGSYAGSGVGLSSGGDAVNLYNSAGLLQASVLFGASPAGPFATFDNAAALNATTISQLSAVGVNGAFVAVNDVNEIGSPGAIVTTEFVNKAPSISIISPVTGNPYSAGTPISLDVQASDSDGNVTKVEFYNAGVKFAEDTTAPFGLAGQVVEPGNYVLTAVATDNDGASTVSDTVKITVTGCNGSGSISAEGYSNIPGGAVADLTSSPAYPDHADVVASLTQFEYGNNLGENYGARVRGYICAPVTGEYTFYVAGDDQAGLWLSTDENPANKVLIAYNLTHVAPRSWYTYSTQKSVKIKLAKGARYYIETLHKESTSIDHLSVAWSLPGGAFEGPIPGSRLSPWNTPSGVRVQDFNTVMEMKNVDGLKVIVTPNPSPNHFTLTTTSNSSQTITITVVDVFGKVAERKLNVPANGTVQVGSNLRAGIYFAEIMQGTQKQTIKLIKQ